MKNPAARAQRSFPVLHHRNKKYIPHTAAHSVVAWLFGLLVSPSATGLAATMIMPRIAGKTLTTLRMKRYVPTSASIIAIGLIQNASHVPELPPIHSAIAISNGYPSGYFG